MAGCDTCGAKKALSRHHSPKAFSLRRGPLTAVEIVAEDLAGNVVQLLGLGNLRSLRAHAFELSALETQSRIRSQGHPADPGRICLAPHLAREHEGDLGAEALEVVVRLAREGLRSGGSPESALDGVPGRSERCTASQIGLIRRCTYVAEARQAGHTEALGSSDHGQHHEHSEHHRSRTTRARVARISSWSQRRSALTFSGAQHASSGGRSADGGTANGRRGLVDILF
eukprot:scaffold63_cov306-Pinguiococcus_pyrenoidosus.AAC.78